ncbi:hypothetical protein HFN63_34095 [Rhizobium leguminosarum]|uniref:hypothetical protein n=1 Tax=Rhizobium leguminosarum TaxID=384 RepID=UPI001C94144F|nr:hypothetical protein [Rhizobium leguminosarum]
MSQSVPTCHHALDCSAQSLQGANSGSDDFATGACGPVDFSDDQADLGHPVTFVEAEKITYRCRPDGLRRQSETSSKMQSAMVQWRRFSFGIEMPLDIVVEDCGPGIPEAMKEKVFAPFFRLEMSRTSETGGIGSDCR